jgi:hypothetical protein
VGERWIQGRALQSQGKLVQLGLRLLPFHPLPQAMAGHKPVQPRLPQPQAQRRWPLTHRLHENRNLSRALPLLSPPFWGVFHVAGLGAGLASARLQAGAVGHIPRTRLHIHQAGAAQVDQEGRA